MFEKFVKHNITSCNEQFFCHLCTCVKTNFEDVLHHIDDKNHQKLKNDKLDIKVQNYIEEIHQEHLDNDVIIIILHSFMCIPCQKHFIDLTSLLQHILGKRHIKNLKDKDINFNCNEVKGVICNGLTRKLQYHELKLLLKASKAHWKHDINNEYSKYTHLKDFITLYNYSNKVYETLTNNRVIMYKSYQLMCRFCNHCYKVPKDILQHIDATKHAHKFENTNIKLSESKNEEVLHIENVNTETNEKIVQLNFTEMKCTKKDAGAELLQYISKITSQKQNINDKHILPHVQSLKKQSEQRITTIVSNISKIKGKNWLKILHQTLLDNGIIINGSNNFSCTSCKRDIISLHDILTHIKGKSHKNMLKNHSEKLCISDSTNINQKYSLDTKTCTTENNKIVDESKCDITFQNCIYTCELCNKKMNINNLFEHNNTDTHKCNIFFTSMGDNIIFFKCFCCKLIIQGNRLFINHLSSASHLNNLTNLLMYLKTNSIETFTCASHYVKNILEDKNFPLCNILIPKVQNAYTYFEEICFIYFDIQNIKCYDNIRNNIFYTVFCSTALNADHNLIYHCQARMFLWKIKELLGLTEMQNEQSSTNNIAIITEHISKVSINDKRTNISNKPDNDFIITSDIDAEIKNCLNISPLKSKAKNKFIKKPVLECLNKSYDEKYFEIEDEMYTVDKQKIKYIQLNLKLFIPCGKNFYCMACNQRVSTKLYLLYEHMCCTSHKQNVYNVKIKEFEMAKEYMKIELKNLIMCYSCKFNIKNNTNSINAHINNSIHKERKKMYDEFKDSYFNCIVENLNTLWYSIQRYSCVLCKINFKYKMEFIEHIMAKHNELLRDHVFDFCIPCTTLWLDTKDSYTDHCNDLLHKYLIKSEDFMIENLPGCMHKILTQVDEISDILFKESQFLLNDSIQQEVEQLLENSFKSHFPSVKAYSFGSRVTGLAFRDSDIDIYLDCEGACYQDESEHLENNYITIITQVLQQHTKEWDVRKIIKNARIPVIKLIYKRKNIYCDISITNSLSVENSKLIRSYNDAYPPCRKLILFIKKWFSYFNLSTGHNFKNYALTWFVIFYLQFESHLESVAALIKKQNKSKVIWGWETGVAQPERNNKSVQQQSISTLLIGFFKFYATFDYQRYIICPLMGQPVARRAFAMLHMLPEEMMPYIKHVAISKNPEYFRIDSPLCVQDPFDLSHNLTKAVSSITLKCFKQYCQDSTSILLSLTK